MSSTFIDFIRSSYNSYVEGNVSYQYFLNFVNSSEPAWNSNINREELFAQFPEKQHELPNSEFENGQVMEGVLTDPPDVGDLSDEPISSWYDATRFSTVQGSELYKRVLVNSTKGFSEEARLEVEKSSRQIVSRCTDPLSWDRNRQGLVFGMVQSGKTLSMINVVNQAFHTGYRMVILFAGDKNSLRSQCQDRFVDAFEIDVNNQPFGIHCPTTYDDITRGPYKSSTGSFRSEAFFNTNMILKRRGLGKNWHLLIVMKKQKNQLEQLLQALSDLKGWMRNRGQPLSFEFDLPTLIIDDESHYASIDTLPNSEDQDKAAIHRLIKEIIHYIPRNNYLGYTATPQSVIAAREGEYNYPSDFVWLLEPKYLDSQRRNTVSYLGGNEFFHTYFDDLVHLTNDNIWPHNQKDWDGSNIQGVYFPDIDSEGGSFLDIGLNDAESNFLGQLLDGNRAIPEDFISALLYFFVGGGYRWWQHYLSYFYKYDKYKSIRSISASTIKAKYPDSKLKIDKEFPFHAIMFNLSSVKKNHDKIARLIQDKFIPLAKNIWNRYRNGHIEDVEKIKNIYADISRRDGFSIDDASAESLDYFVDLFVQVAISKIPGKNRLTYVVNSENDKLIYGKDHDEDDRVKKAAIIVGGNILAMGLTIEGLAVSFFTRTQNDTKMDTNLQMCRWFGHKKSYMYSVKVFTLYECIRIYRDIADADDQLRREIKLLIKQGLKPKNVLLGIRNSAFFRATSVKKSQYLVGSTDESFSGSVSALMEPIFKREDIITNYTLLTELISAMRDKGSEFVHERAELFRNVDKELVFNFLDNFQSKNGAFNVNAREYGEYLKMWDSSDRFSELPKINVGIFKYIQDNGEVKLTKRRRRFKCSINEEHTMKEVKSMVTSRLESLIGGRSQDGNYLGDRYLDFSPSWHSKYKIMSGPDLTEEGWSHRSEILLVFYLIDPNYLCNIKLKDRSKDPLFLEPGDSHYVDNKLNGIEIGTPTFMTVTPRGGPMWDVGTNSTITEILDNRVY